LPQYDNKGTLKPTKYKLQMDHKKWVIYSAVLCLVNLYISANLIAVLVKQFFTDWMSKVLSLVKKLSHFLFYIMVKTALMLASCFSDSTLK
jgi:hypothetical protein